MIPRTPDFPPVFAEIGRFFFGLAGWRVEGELPDYPKMVVIGAPHTSNWDGVVFVLTTFVLRTRMRWLGKHSLFIPPIGILTRFLGGIAINRKTTRNAVEQVVEVIEESDRIVLVIAPEGTRKKTAFWKTGFYYIALNAKVPIVMAYFIYPQKVIGIGPTLHPSGDIEADFAIIQAFYSDKVGRHPEKKSDIALPPPKH